MAYCLERAKKDNPGRKKGKNEKYSSYLLDTGWHWGEWIEPDWNGFIKHRRSRWNLPERYIMNMVHRKSALHIYLTAAISPQKWQKLLDTRKKQNSIVK